MQFLPLPIALAISLFIGVWATMMSLPASSQGGAIKAAQEQCNAYAVLHARLASIEATEHFAGNIASCMETLTRR